MGYVKASSEKIIGQLTCVVCGRLNSFVTSYPLRNSLISIQFTKHVV